MISFDAYNYSPHLTGQVSSHVFFQRTNWNRVRRDLYMVNLRLKPRASNMYIHLIQKSILTDIFRITFDQISGQPVARWNWHINKVSHLFGNTYLWLPISQLLRWLSCKESVCQCRRHRFDPWVRKIPWRRKGHSTPVFLPGKSRSYRQRTLAGCNPWRLKESYMT